MNAVNSTKAGRALLESSLGVDKRAPIPTYHSNSARKRLAKRPAANIEVEATQDTTGRVAIFTTCYGNRNAPEIVTDLAAVFEHNGIAVTSVPSEQCCGMPQLELGNLAAIDQSRAANVAALLPYVQDGWDIVAPVPSCVLMFKQELPLLFPNDVDVAAVANAFFDPFEYLVLRHKAGKFNTNFANSLGNVAYQVPCHLRVQNIGFKTREVFELVPDTQVSLVERCSGHDGTYGVKKRFRDAAEKIARPVVRQVNQAQPDHLTSDCPMAGEQIDQLSDAPGLYRHPLSLLRTAYGL